MEVNHNYYWSIYKNIENEFEEMSYYVHMDNRQSSTFSSKSADLILRCGSEIEALSKELYFAERSVDKATDQIKFDHEAIKCLNSLWKLDQKRVIIKSTNVYLSNRDLFPFKKNVKKPNGKETFAWNLAYQNLKHNRSKYYHFASIENLIHIISSLYVLNIYLGNGVIDESKNYDHGNIPYSMGSKLFSVVCHVPKAHSKQGEIRNENFDESILRLTHDKNTRDRWLRAEKAREEFHKKLTLNSIEQHFKKQGKNFYDKLDTQVNLSGSKDEIVKGLQDEFFGKDWKNKFALAAAQEFQRVFGGNPSYTIHVNKHQELK